MSQCDRHGGLPAYPRGVSRRSSRSNGNNGGSPSSRAAVQGSAHSAAPPSTGCARSRRCRDPDPFGGRPPIDQIEIRQKTYVTAKVQPLDVTGVRTVTRRSRALAHRLRRAAAVLLDAAGERPRLVAVDVPGRLRPRAARPRVLPSPAQPDWRSAPEQEVETSPSAPPGSRGGRSAYSTISTSASAQPASLVVPRRPRHRVEDRGGCRRSALLRLRADVGVGAAAVVERNGLAVAR